MFVRVLVEGNLQTSENLFYTNPASKEVFTFLDCMELFFSNENGLSDPSSNQAMHFFLL